MNGLILYFLLLRFFSSDKPVTKNHKPTKVSLFFSQFLLFLTWNNKKIHKCLFLQTWLGTTTKQVSKDKKKSQTVSPMKSEGQIRTVQTFVLSSCSRKCNHIHRWSFITKMSKSKINQNERIKKLLLELF